MDEREALLAAIIADPEDDLPRLVYADWLEERGAGSDVARARLIRLQIEMARMSDEDDRRRAHIVECEHLIEQHWREWSYGFRAHQSYGIYVKEGFSRGFLPCLYLSSDDLNDPKLEILLAHEPITDFLLRQIDKFPAAIADWHHLPRVRELRFGGVACDNVKTLLRSPLLTGLRSLDGWRMLGEDDVTLIATDPRFAGLTYLNIGLNGLPDGAVEVVAQSSILSRLIELDLSINRMTAAGLQVLANSSLASRLTLLGLQSGLYESSRLGPRAADLLAGFRSLRALNLSGQQIGDDGAATLAQSPSLSGLRTLLLSDNSLGVRGVTKLLSSPHFARLEVLDLSKNLPGSEWTPAFAAAEPRSLRELWMENSQLDARAAALLASAPALVGLDKLSLRQNPIGDSGAVALARSTTLSGLRVLILRSCGIGDEGATALADSPGLSRLEQSGGLSLAGNQYGPEAARRLRERFGYDPSNS